MNFEDFWHRSKRNAIFYDSWRVLSSNSRWITHCKLSAPDKRCIVTVQYFIHRLCTHSRDACNIPYVSTFLFFASWNVVCNSMQIYVSLWRNPISIYGIICHPTDHNAGCDLFLAGAHRSGEKNRRVDETTRGGDGKARRGGGILR